MDPLSLSIDQKIELLKAASELYGKVPMYGESEEIEIKRIHDMLTKVLFECS